MAISETNLKLLKSERMTDFTDGGGKMSGVEVVDGLVNNLFNDISQLDRTYGRVSLRKEYAVVQTDNTDTYLGAHIILTDPPDDPNVNVTLFSTGSWTDERNVARNYIENYSVQGPESRWVVYGDQIIGQRQLLLYSQSNTINIYTPAADPSPEIGDVMMLSTEKAGFTPNYQYVRITKIVSRVTQMFTDEHGDFFKDVLTLEIGNPLQYLFPGNATPGRYLGSAPTLFRKTTVADTAQYYGVKKITEALAISDLTVTVDSPYTAIVPSALAETPLVDIAGNMTLPNYAQSGTTALSVSATLTGSLAPDYAASLYLSRGFLPGSLAITIGGVDYKDNSKGILVLASGALGSYTGVIDYASGTVVLNKTSGWSAAVSATATPAVAVYNNACTADIPITINNRSFSYVMTLNPIPTPGSLIIDYKALNRWYRLYDDGQGHLSGAVAGVGAGTINYATGGVMVTLSTLPDVGSPVLFDWTTPLDYNMQTYVVQQPLPAIDVTLVNTPVVPGSLTITWVDGGSRTATADANGTIGGYATGRLVAANGSLRFFPTQIPPSGTEFTFTYQQVLQKTDVLSVTGDTYGEVTFTLTNTPITPGSVSLGYHVSVPGNDQAFADTETIFTEPTVNVPIGITDNGAGGFNQGYTGSINYATGVVVLQSTKTRSIIKVVGFIRYSTKINGVPANNVSVLRSLVTVSETLAGSTTLTAHYSLDTDTPAVKIESTTLSELKVDLATATGEALVANGVKFSFAGSTFIDRQGLLYRNHNVTNNSATLSGNLDYQTGLATLTAWPGGSPTLSILSAVSIKGQNYVSNVVGRAPGAPLAVGQFQINATTAKGAAINASADNNGNITHDWAMGHIDWQTGVYEVLYGQRILDSTVPADVKANSGWYNAADVGLDGKIWCPTLVKPETITFNAVLSSYIPLDASVLGMDTVRLPQDGRVPLYRIGGVAVVHNTQTFNLPDPAVAGTTHDCGRTLLSYARLFDANGLIIPTAKYTTDLDAGTLTLSNPCDLTGYVQPLKCEHRIEDMALITDVQITGQIKLMKPVRHVYPANTSYLSSALVIGDLQGRYTNLFDQQTWTSEFSDNLIGGAATPSYNDTLYPLTMTNAGSIQERWAIVFTGSTAFNLYGEYSGLIAQHTTGSDFSPINPITSTPYFTMNYLGWGTGWAAGNVVRFNTIGANTPLWLARTTLQSDPSVYTDNFKIQIRGDAN